jgi:hypothetical protein
VLNGRLYRLAWLVAGVALVVALLTLQSPQGAPEPGLPPAFDAAGAVALADAMTRDFPTRPPGSPADRASADWIAGELGKVPGLGPRRVRRQAFAVRTPSGRITTQNVYVALPSRTATAVRRGILVVAPRDTPPGVAGGETGSAVLVQLAATFATAAHDRPLFFVSTGAGTLGNAGVRWFLSRFRAVPLAAVVVLDAPGEAQGPVVHLWDAGRTDAQALGLNQIAAQAVRRVGGRVADDEGAWDQVARLAVPQTVGDQGPAIADGLPAVTLSGRPESPLPPNESPPDDERLRVVGAAAESLIGSLDAVDQVPPPSGAVAIGGRELRPAMARVALLLLALPLLVAAVDTLARLRRARVRVGPGVAALARTAAPPLVALAVLYLLSVAGVLPGPSGGAPPAGAEVPFDAPAGLAVVLALLAAAATWWVLRLTAGRGARRRRGDAVEVPVRAGVAVVALAALLLVAWVTRPFFLVLALPAAHAGLAASVARRRWQVAVLAVIAVVPLAAVCVSIAGVVDLNPAATAWYLVETAASGARGWGGPVLGVLVGACVWSLGGLVAFRARKGLVTAGGDAGEGRRRRGRPGPAAPTLDDRPRRRADEWPDPRRYGLGDAPTLDDRPRPRRERPPPPTMS